MGGQRHAGIKSEESGGDPLWRERGGRGGRESGRAGEPGRWGT
jgi:hypothetical protein